MIVQHYAILSVTGSGLMSASCHNVMPCLLLQYVISRHVMSDHIMPCCRVLLSYVVMSCDAAL